VIFIDSLSLTTLPAEPYCPHILTPLDQNACVGAHKVLQLLNVVGDVDRLNVGERPYAAALAPSGELPRRVQIGLACGRLLICAVKNSRTRRATAGFGRIFVATDGALYICEKVRRAVALGSVDRGIEADRVMELYSLYWRRRYDRCSRCWAIGLCGLCYVHFIRGAREYDTSVEQQECRAAMEFYREVLTRYCAILEENPKAFDHLDNAIVGSPPDWVRL
jgi:radical SAM protein with 4Fe4S-binding SPASM domain